MWPRHIDVCAPLLFLTSFTTLATSVNPVQESSDLGEPSSIQLESEQPVRMDDAVTRFVAVNYCDHTEEMIIRKSAAEVEQILTKGLAKLESLRLEVWRRLHREGETSSEEIKNEEECLVQTYYVFWDVLPLVFGYDGKKASSEALLRIRSLMNLIEYNMLPEMRGSSPVIEITCNHPWLIRYPQEYALPENVLGRIHSMLGKKGGTLDDYLKNGLYDARASVSRNTPIEDRYLINDDPVIARSAFEYFQTPEAVFFDDSLGPLKDVLALNTSYFPRWSDLSENVDALNHVYSLDDLNSRTSYVQFLPGAEFHEMYVPENFYQLQNIVRRTLTGVFLYFFPQMASLTGERRKLGRFKPSNWQDGDPKDELIRSFREMIQETKNRYLKDADNFAYFMMALYLDEWQWTTGNNTIPGETSFNRGEHLTDIGL